MNERVYLGIDRIEARVIPGYPRHAITDKGVLYARKGRTPESRRGLWNVWVKRLPWYADGYPYYSLGIGAGKTKNIPAHRAVLLAWVGPPGVGQECLHGDGDRENCKLSNLRWGTRLENEADKTLHGNGNKGEVHYNAKLTNTQAAICRSLRLRYPGRSGVVTFLAKWFGVHPATMTGIVKGAAYV